MDTSTDSIVNQIVEYAEQIEMYQFTISQLGQKIRELNWQLIKAKKVTQREAENLIGETTLSPMSLILRTSPESVEIPHYDNIA
jgi:hydroxymethylpyrimidine pyrophosphatase-like HAD family hydrolase